MSALCEAEEGTMNDKLLFILGASMLSLPLSGQAHAEALGWPLQPRPSA